MDRSIDYLPWTAYLTDGRKLTVVDTKFDIINNLQGQVLKFSINAPGKDISVDLINGSFNIGTDNLFHPDHITSKVYKLIYLRQCSATLTGGLMKGKVDYYWLGWQVHNAKRVIKISPELKVEWCCAV